MATNSKNCSCLIAKMYEEYVERVKLYFVKYTSDAMKAEDMAQDLFIKLISYSDMICEETAQSLVFSMAKRMVIDDARHQSFVRKATAGYLLKAEEDRFWQDSDTLECRQIADAEIAKMRSLPKQMARVYEMSRFEGKTAKEMAEEMNISKRTVEYHLLMSRREVRSAVRKVVGM